MLRFHEDDRILWVLPLAYHFAVTIVAYVRAGAHVLMCPDTLPGAIVDAIRRLRPSVLYASPLHFERMSNLESGGPLASVRLCLSTSAPITPAVIERFESRYEVAGRTGVRDHRGRPALHQCADRGPAGHLRRPCACRATTSPCSRARARARLRARRATIAVRGERPLLRVLPALAASRAGHPGRLVPDRRHRPAGRVRRAVPQRSAGRPSSSSRGSSSSRRKSRAASTSSRGSRNPGCSVERTLASARCRARRSSSTPAASTWQALKAHCARALSPYKVPVEFTVVEAVPRTSGGKILRRPVRVMGPACPPTIVT